MPRIKGVIYKHYGRKRQWGEADHTTGIIYISDKCTGIKDLEMRHHEGLHLLCPWLSEDAVRIIAAELTRAVWDGGYRKVDNDVMELQDEEHELTDDTVTLSPPSD